MKKLIIILFLISAVGCTDDDVDKQVDRQIDRIEKQETAEKIKQRTDDLDTIKDLQGDNRKAGEFDEWPDWLEKSETSSNSENDN